MTLDQFIDRLTAVRRQYGGDCEVVDLGEFGYYSAEVYEEQRTLYVPRELYTGGPWERRCVVLGADNVRLWKEDNPAEGNA